MRERNKKRRDNKVIKVNSIKEIEKIKPVVQDETIIAVLPSGNGIIIPNDNNTKIRKTKYSLF